MTPGPELRELTATLNGVRLAALAAGPRDGPLALLLHGWPDTASSWTRTLGWLARRGFHAVAPALRGYAPSDVPPNGDYRVETLGKDVLGWIDALGAARATLIGHDWGAFAAYAAVQLAPARIERLAIVAIPHPCLFVPTSLTARRAWGARHFFEYLLPGAAGRIRRDLAGHLDAVYRRWSPAWNHRSPDELVPALEALGPPGRLEAALGFYRSLPLGLAPALIRRPVTVPSLLLAGLADGAADRELFVQSRRWFTGPFELLELERAGHFLHREQPESFEAALERWLTTCA